MLNLASIKDPHFNFGFLNKIRANYNRDMIIKLDYIKSYFSVNKINCCIFTGDITDSNYEKKWSFKQYVKNKREFEKLKDSLVDYKDFSKKLVSNVGNHDMFHGLEDTQDTIFEELVRENIIDNISNYTLTYSPINTNSNNLVRIYGVDYSANKDTIIDKLKIIDSDSYIGYNLFKIVVLHNNLTPTKDRLSEFTYDFLADNFTTINIFIGGHYHLGFPTTKLNNAIFINNWNLTRVVRDYDISLDNHTPEFEMIRFDDDLHFIGTETIKIPFIKYDEAFIPKAINIIKKSKQEIFDFFKIDFSEVLVKQSDEEIIAQFNYEPDIVQIAIEYLNKE